MHAGLLGLWPLLLRTINGNNKYLEQWSNSASLRVVPGSPGSLGICQKRELPGLIPGHLPQILWGWAQQFGLAKPPGVIPTQVREPPLYYHVATGLPLTTVTSWSLVEHSWRQFHDFLMGRLLECKQDCLWNSNSSRYFIQRWFRSPSWAHRVISPLPFFEERLAGQVFSVSRYGCSGDYPQRNGLCHLLLSSMCSVM